MQLRGTRLSTCNIHARLWMSICFVRSICYWTPPTRFDGRIFEKFKIRTLEAKIFIWTIANVLEIFECVFQALYNIEQLTHTNDDLHAPHMHHRYDMWIKLPKFYSFINDRHRQRLRVTALRNIIRLKKVWKICFICCCWTCDYTLHSTDIKCDIVLVLSFNNRNNY